METVEAIYQRRAIRAFEDRNIPQDAIADLIDDAIQAPIAIKSLDASVRHITPWEFVVLGYRTRLEEVSDCARHYARDPTNGLPPRFAQMAEYEGFASCYGAPIMLLICATSDDEQSSWDCCRAAQNMMLSATARGFGSNWIGSTLPWLKSDAGRRDCAIPDGAFPVAPIVVGFAAEAPKPPGRAVPTVTWSTPDGE